MPIATDDVIESKDFTNVKESKEYVRGDESTDDQSSSCGGQESTDESSTLSDGDILPSRRPSNDSSASTAVSELLPSVGSALHFTAECQRCCFFPKGSCSNGKDCNFCHFDHEARPRRSKRGGSKKAEENSALASDSHVQGEPTVVPSAPAPVPLLAKPPGLPTPKGNNFAGFCPMLLNLQAHESQETLHLKQASCGKPMKVWLPELASSNKQLERTIPAKKRPPYPELSKAGRPALDPSQPVKKRVPVFTEGFLEGAFSEPAKRVSTKPAASVHAPR